MLAGQNVAAGGNSTQKPAAQREFVREILSWYFMVLPMTSNVCFQRKDIPRMEKAGKLFFSATCPHYQHQAKDGEGNHRDFLVRSTCKEAVVLCAGEVGLRGIQPTDPTKDKDVA